MSEILQQFREDAAWLTHQLEQRHPKFLISKLNLRAIRYIDIYRIVCERAKPCPTEHDAVMGRRMDFLLAIERRLGLKGPYG